MRPKVWNAKDRLSSNYLHVSVIGQQLRLLDFSQYLTANWLILARNYPFNINVGLFEIRKDAALLFKRRSRLVSDLRVTRLVQLW